MTGLAAVLVLSLVEIVCTIWMVRGYYKRITQWHQVNTESHGCRMSGDLLSSIHLNGDEWG